MAVAAGAYYLLTYLLTYLLAISPPSSTFSRITPYCSFSLSCAFTGLFVARTQTLSAALRLVARGNANRHVGTTKMNVASSRSHLVLTLRSELLLGGTTGGGGAGGVGGVGVGGGVDVGGVSGGPGGANGRRLLGKLHLVDLAGSERVKLSEAQGVRMAEVSWLTD